MALEVADFVGFVEVEFVEQIIGALGAVVIGVEVGVLIGRKNLSGRSLSTRLNFSE